MLISPTINSVHGRLFWHTGTNPAAGAEISETVPDRHRWKIWGFASRLITDANAADRRVILQTDDGTTNLTAAISSAVHTASLDRYYSFSDTGVDAFLISNRFVSPITPITLPPGSRITTTTVNIQVGDDWAAPLMLVEEWIDP